MRLVRHRADRTHTDRRPSGRQHPGRQHPGRQRSGRRRPRAARPTKLGGSFAARALGGGPCHTIAAGLAALVLGAIIAGVLTGQAKIAIGIAVILVCLSSLLFHTWDAQQGAPSKARKLVDVTLRVAAAALLIAVMVFVIPGDGGGV